MCLCVCVLVCVLVCVCGGGGGGSYINSTCIDQLKTDVSDSLIIFRLLLLKKRYNCAKINIQDKIQKDRIQRLQSQANESY